MPNDHHRPGVITEADQLPGKIPADAEENIRYVLKKYLPGAGDKIIGVKTCLYTYSRDANFFIDHLPGYDKRVAIACGFSGHGFKFVSVVGEILADLAMKGKTELPIGFLKLRTF
ncbi:MAG: FAD-dependent oxidoreductase [Cyclobacteriaceae bacterium]